MELVKFKNGKYGIRKRAFFRYEYLSTNGYWWSKTRALDFDLEHNEETARKLLASLTDEGEPV